MNEDGRASVEGEDSRPHTAPPGWGRLFIVGRSLTNGKLMTRINYVAGVWKDCRPSVMVIKYIPTLKIIPSYPPIYRHHGPTFNNITPINSLNNPF
jgi:hypothetical protein